MLSMIDPAGEAMPGLRIPVAPQRKVLEQQPGADRHFLAAKVTGPGAVDVVFVNGHGDEAAACQQLAEVGITRIGIVFHAVVAVHDQHQRKRARAVRRPDQPVERRLVEAKSPERLAHAFLMPFHSGSSSAASTVRDSRSRCSPKSGRLALFPAP